MSKTTQNAKHLIKVNIFGIDDKINKLKKKRRGTKANK